MTYIDKKSKAFMVAPERIIVPVRSEARMKNYISATDARAWSDIVEERRQHILEYSAKNKEGFCIDKFIPLEVLFNTMMQGKNIEIKRLQKKMRCLEKCINIYSKLKLTPEQERQLKIMKSEMEKTCGRLDCLQRVTLNNVIGACRRQVMGEHSNTKRNCCSKYCSNCRTSPVDAIKSRYYTANNEILKNCQQRKCCTPFSLCSDTGCKEELTDNKTHTSITDDKCDCCCCTETSLYEINNKETRCTCTNTHIIQCKNKLIETVDKCIKFTSQQDQLECCNDTLYDTICPCKEECEIEFDQCCCHPEDQEPMDICLKEIEDLEENTCMNACQTMIMMKRKLEAMELENKKQLQIANASSDHEQLLQNIFNQSEYIKCISGELEKQYQQWNQTRCQQQSDDVFAEVNFCCHCNLKSIELPELTNSKCSIDLEHELEDIEREKEKLIELVKELEKATTSEDILDCLKSDNTKLQKQLQREVLYRKYLEQTLLNVLN